MYQISPAKSSSFLALAHLVIGAPKNHCVRVMSYDVINYADMADVFTCVDMFVSAVARVCVDDARWHDKGNMRPSIHTPISKQRKYFMVIFFSDMADEVDEM